MANRRIAGVAAGLSDFFGIDATLIRVLIVVSVFFTSGASALIYVICWLVIPRSSASGTPAPARHRGLAWVVAVVALAIGAGMALNDHRSWIIAVVAFAAAAWVWLRIRGRRSWKTRKEFEKARLAWQRRLDQQASQANHTAYLGGDPFQIGSFYPQPPPDQPGAGDDPTSGFQTQ